MMDQSDVGFRPLVTRAPLATRLVASPTEYDAAPAYLARAYRERSDEVRREVGLRMADELASGAIGDSLGRQVLIAVELVAPIGMGIVRVAALATRIASLANPVGALLNGPALFFSARNTLRDLRRALSVDPKVRALIERATMLSERGDLRGAERTLKHALEQDINPDYARNGDLYLQLGMVQMSDARAREAMVSFAKASVLFREDDSFIYRGPDGRSGKISKRGLTELLACVAIDSFASSERGLLEWQSVLEDFSGSAQLRLDRFSDLTERGLGHRLLGRGQEGITLGRELSAKARFLSAKMRLRASGFQDSADIDAIIDDALRELRGAGLERDELFMALMEQAQFYCDVAQNRAGESPAHATRALRLMREAGEIVESYDALEAARVRAEAISFAARVIPESVARSLDVGPLRREVAGLIERLDEQMEHQPMDAPYAGVAHGWVREQRYKFAQDPATKRGAARATYDAYIAAGEPVAAMYGALRMAFASEEPEERRAALEMLAAAAVQVLDGRCDLVSQAFAAKYLLDAAQAEGATPEGWTRARSAELFARAADEVFTERAYVPFFLHGSPVIHGFERARSILLGHAAIEYARAGRSLEAIAHLERVRAYEFDASPEVELALELEYANLLIFAGQSERAVELLDELERRARREELMTIHHRALELLHTLSGNDPDGTSDDHASSGIPQLEAPGDDGGFLGEHLARRRMLERLGRSLVDAMGEHGSLDDHRERIEGRLERLEQGRFRLGIVGEFSAGKSTFLNALVGSLVLPSSVRPTTSTVTRLRWSDEPSCTVRFEDGRAEEIDLKDLKRYVTERKNPGNKLGVAEIDIGYPLEILRRGVELIDTPGISSLIEAHTKTTYGLIPQCDAVLLLATGRQPFSESIGAFLGDLRSFVDGKIFYVLNKIDQLDPARVPSSLDFAREHVLEHVAKATVHPLASYHALAGRRLESGEANVDDYEDDPRLGEETDAAKLVEGSGILELEDAVSTFLHEHGGAALIADAAADLLRSTVEAERVLGAEVAAEKMDAAERLEEHRRLTREHHQHTQRFESRLSALDERLRDTVERIVSRPGDEVPGLEDEVYARIGLAAMEVRGLDTDLVKQRTEVAMRQTIVSYVESLGYELSSSLSRYQQEARRELFEIQRELRGEFGGTFDLPEVSLSAQGPQGLDMEVASQNGLVEAVVGFASGSALGFVGGLLLGPIGIALAMFGQAFLGSRISAHFEERTRSKLEVELRAVIRHALGEAAVAIEQDLKDRTDEAIEHGRKTIEALRDQCFEEFDGQLSSLIYERQEGELAAQERIASVKSTRDQLARARTALAGFMERER